MRKIAYGLYASSLLLLLVGAGCAGSQKVEIRTTPGGAAASVDAAVDGVIKKSDSEQAEQTKSEADVEAINADSEELNAFGNASYDVE